MANLGSLTYDLVANTAKFEKGLTRAQRMAQKRSRAIGKAFRGLGAIIGVALGGASLAAARNAAAALGQISDQADKLGLTTDQLQLMRFAAEQSGVAIKAFDVGFQRFTRRVADANAGQAQLAKTFDTFKISLQDANGVARSSFDVFLDFADAISESNDQGERILKTFQLFDTEGVDLVRALQKGAAQFRATMAAGRDMGVVIDEHVIRNADAADKKLTAMSRVMDAQLKPVLVELAPLLLAAATKMAGLAKSAADFFRAIGFTKSSNPVVIYTDAIDTLNKKLDGARTRQGSAIQKGIEFFGGPSPTQVQDDIDRMERDLAVLEKARQHFMDSAGGGAGQPPLGLPPTTDATTKTFKEITDELAAQNETLNAQIHGYEERLEITRAIAKAEDDLGRSLTTQESVTISRFIKQGNDHQKMLDRMAHQQEETLEEMSVFAEQAARNMQDAFAEFLFDPFEEDGLAGMLEGFADTLRKMAAQAAAAKIFEAIGSGLSGSANAFAAGIGSFFAGGTQKGAPIVEYQATPQARALGGPLGANQLALVGERGPELFVPGVGGTIIPNSGLGGGLEINIHNAPPGTRAEGSQGAGGINVVDLFLGEVAADISRNGVVGQALDVSRGTRIAPVAR